MVVCTRELQQWLGAEILRQASVSAWQARLLAAGRGCCFPACTALQPHYMGSQSFGLIGMKIILKITPLCIPNRELMALFCLTGKDKETTTPQWPRLM